MLTPFMLYKRSMTRRSPLRFSLFGLIDRLPEKAQRQTLRTERFITWNAEPDKIMAVMSQESLANKLRPARSPHKDRDTLPFS
jgi:hypothetical protein